MADLLDIAPSTAVETVTISGGRTLTVHGLQSDNIAFLVSRFPDLVPKLVMLFAGGDDAIVSRLFVQLGPAIGPIIACANDHQGNEKAEHNASKSLLLEDQVKLVAVIYRLTFPNGLAAFLETLTGLMGEAADERPKVVKIRLRTSPSGSPPSSDEGFRQAMQ